LSRNVNPWVGSLLTWHGHSSAGVRIPFHETGGSPLRNTSGIIRTPLLERLEDAARDIASGTTSPRWIFLVGGPGNGKSEAVEQFLASLDSALGCEGQLVDRLRAGFAPQPLVPWCVEINSENAPELPENFRRRVGRLIVVQDASASDYPHRTAAERLVNYAEDLLTHQDPLPVFVCCANRGLLANALKVAAVPQITTFLRVIIQATGLGRDALSANRPDCWPVAMPDVAAGQVACWPLDLETLIVSPQRPEYSASPVVQMFQEATSSLRWEEGACATCDSAPICPFNQNASWLQNSEHLAALVTILRRTELATAQRWNFRDLFSLVAELLVGEWPDFEGFDSPCEWVHAQNDIVSSDAAPETLVDPALKLVSRLYPHALFPVVPAPTSTELFDDPDHPLTGAFAQSLATFEVPAATHIRRQLQARMTVAMDPAALSPHDARHPLSTLEDSYSQSPTMGNTSWPPAMRMSRCEEILFGLGADAADEWDILSSRSRAMGKAIPFLKALLSAFAKRSVGVRLGHHAHELYLSEYEVAIRDAGALRTIQQHASELLGRTGFSFNVLAGLGQPQSEREWHVVLNGNRVRVRPIESAPAPSPTRPGHDYPLLRIGDPVVGVIPLTFDMYVALRLRRDGCESSSLPASVRAALDRLKQLHAGALCRSDSEFVEDVASVVAGTGNIISLNRLGESPVLRD
jgi:hypothetical protein